MQINETTPVGTKIRCVDTGGFSFLTKGKVYEIVKPQDQWDAWFVDDDGDVMFTNEDTWDKFEIVED